MIHGALDHAELAVLGLLPEAICDFSSNINPFGPPTTVRVTLAGLDPAPYPDRSCHQLRQALAARHSCAPEQVLVGNGSSELIHLIARALLRPGDRALVVEPTFGEYAHAARLAGAQVVVWRAEERHAFTVDIDALCNIVRRHQPRVTWLCAPNNPTGVPIATGDLLLLAMACANTDGLLVVDRTYATFELGMGPNTDVLDGQAASNLLRLHSLTKSHAIAGLRLGYLLAEPAVGARVARYQPTWSVSSAAQAAGLAALADCDFLPQTLPRLWRASDELRDGLCQLDLPVWRRALPFMLVRTGDGAQTRARLLARGYAVRDCASFGLPTYVRVAPRTFEENRRLLAVWETLL